MVLLEDLAALTGCICVAWAEAAAAERRYLYVTSKNPRCFLFAIPALFYISRKSKGGKGYVLIADQCTLLGRREFFVEAK